MILCCECEWSTIKSKAKNNCANQGKTRASNAE